MHSGLARPRDALQGFNAHQAFASNPNRRKRSWQGERPSRQRSPSVAWDVSSRWRSRGAVRPRSRRDRRRGGRSTRQGRCRVRLRAGLGVCRLRVALDPQRHGIRAGERDRRRPATASGPGVAVRATAVIGAVVGAVAGPGALIDVTTRAVSARRCGDRRVAADRRRQRRSIESPRSPGEGDGPDQRERKRNAGMSAAARRRPPRIRVGARCPRTWPSTARTSVVPALHRAHPLRRPRHAAPLPAPAPAASVGAPSCRGDGGGGTASPLSARRTASTFCGRCSGASAKVQSMVASKLARTRGMVEPACEARVGSVSRTARTPTASERGR